MSTKNHYLQIKFGDDEIVSQLRNQKLKTEEET